MNRDPRLASRSFKMASLAFALLALSSAAIVAAAQQLPDQFRSDSDDDTTFDVLAAAPEAGFTVASTAVDALSAGPREVRATSEKVSDATPAHHRVPVVTDWSTKHVVFAKPQDSKRRGAPGAQHALQDAGRPPQRPGVPEDSGRPRGQFQTCSNRFRNRVHDPHSQPHARQCLLHRDWSVQLNGNGTTSSTPIVGASQFPAKFSFDINAPPDCQ